MGLTPCARSNRWDNCQSQKLNIASYWGLLGRLPPGWEPLQILLFGCVFIVQWCWHDFSDHRPVSLTWSTSQGCITGTPALTPGPPFATCVERLCRGSPLMVFPVKVNINTKLFLYRCLSVSCFPYCLFHSRILYEQFVWIFPSGAIYYFMHSLFCL